MKSSLVVCICCIVMLCGCTSYRYSGRVLCYPYDQMRLADFSIRQCEVVGQKSDGPMKLLRNDRLMEALGESDVSRKRCKRVKLKLQTQARFYGDPAASYLLLGLLPATQKWVTKVTVNVIEGEEINRRKDFALEIEEERRFTPLGLWPFVGANYENEYYAVCNGLNPEEERITHFNHMLGFLILRGMTKEFNKEGE